METKGSFCYDFPRCKKTILAKNQIGYDKFIDRVYTYMGLDWDSFKLNLWFRNSIGLGVFAGMRLECENDIDIMYHMKAMSSQMAYEIYVEVESQFRQSYGNINVGQTSWGIDGSKLNWTVWLLYHLL